ncbi:class I SAM-dependent methyltransferase [Winogradskyella sp. PG-2]|uniref:class I SAM-dependent methyltransferase n=1 Tax=Winogradskyella sp. PG-2 TaxID=754409 RepID=UPI0004587A53|nr:class I SAM-dependent methyltransferase [Winogradskyella sp. PG-2]BAO74409.1 hypothetical protein WPG_0179 [Winogradskyella sp. PG-2]
MTWEETIEYIRNKPEYNELVEKAYFDENLKLNIKRFGNSKELIETLKIFNKYAPNAKTILDIGCGNGISTINFALKGYTVTAVEPDLSRTVGSGAIKILKNDLNLNNIEVFEDFAENINFSSHTFDIVYMRQAMHHANDLNTFIKESVRVLKPGGLLVTVRDHVITDLEDKDWFLKEHLLHKFYGGENAFKASEYRKAILVAGATIKKELKYYDSIINHFPKTEQQVNEERDKQVIKQKNKLKKKLGIIAKLPLIWDLYKKVSGYQPLDENHIPGRMYTYIALKK